MWLLLMSYGFMKIEIRDVLSARINNRIFSIDFHSGAVAVAILNRGSFLELMFLAELILKSKA